MRCHLVLLHPDYTVGFGIAPNQPIKARGLDFIITAGWNLPYPEEHPHI